MQETAVTTAAHAVQLAVAPVFMLAGIGAILSVMNHRLSRIMDRVRVLETKLEQGVVETRDIEKELDILSRRAGLSIKAITLCTMTALFICSVIATLFLGVTFTFNTGSIVSFLFIMAMCSFFTGLLIFLREIFIAMANLRIAKILVR